ncbi:uncharacterized protein [Macrobrachium rosenbergii]|uniref:uncharacterized protein n=1 Tax=Macrobrachium rosenbergii TaxID=79674 RepID=UPI0034D44531
MYGVWDNSKKRRCSPHTRSHRAVYREVSTSNPRVVAGASVIGREAAGADASWSRDWSGRGFGTRHAASPGAADQSGADASNTSTAASGETDAAAAAAAAAAFAAAAAVEGRRVGGGGRKEASGCCCLGGGGSSSPSSLSSSA